MYRTLGSSISFLSNGFKSINRYDLSVGNGHDALKLKYVNDNYRLKDMHFSSFWNLNLSLWLLQLLLSLIFRVVKTVVFSAANLYKNSSPDHLHTLYEQTAKWKKRSMIQTAGGVLRNTYIPIRRVNNRPAGRSGVKQYVSTFSYWDIKTSGRYICAQTLAMKVS